MSGEPCTTEDCRRLTSLYLCAECIVELDGLLEDVPALIPLLDGPITMTSVTKGPGMGNGSGHPGSKPPINLDALQLRAWLNQLPDRAHAEAMDNPNAGRTLYMARIWVKRARQLVWGSEEETIDHETNRQRVRDIAPPMPTRQLVPWLREHAKITITAKDVRNWALRKKLKAVAEKPSPTYYPHEVLDAWHATRRDQ